MSDRHRETEEPDPMDDPAEKALAEARNALRRFDVGMVLLDRWLDGGRPYVIGAAIGVGLTLALTK